MSCSHWQFRCEQWRCLVNHRTTWAKASMGHGFKMARFSPGFRAIPRSPWTFLEFHSSAVRRLGLVVRRLLVWSWQNNIWGYLRLFFLQQRGDTLHFPRFIIMFAFSDTPTVCKGWLLYIAKCQRTFGNIVTSIPLAHNSVHLCSLKEWMCGSNVWP